MLKVYLDNNDFLEFKKGIFKRTEQYFKSIISNIKSDIDSSEYQYFYTFLLPDLIELDYYHFVSARAIYTGISIKDPLINSVKNLVKESCKKVIHLYKEIQLKDKKKLKTELKKFFYQRNINESTILSLSYFHRHKEYLKQIINHHPVVEIDYNSISKFSSKFKTYRYKENFLKINPTNFYQEQLSDNINFFLTYRRLIYFPCKLLLFSNHGWCNSKFSKLLISYVSTKTSKPIISVQASLNHQSCLCIGQVIWERYVSTKYATWADPISKKDFRIGSMYANKSLKKNDVNNESLLLPQVPFYNIPRCFSHYWTLTFSDFNSQISILEDNIDNILCKSKSPIFRIKHCDLNYYSRNLFKNFKNVDVDYGDVNKGQSFKFSNKNYIFYMSTAIVQSVNSGSETFGVFSVQDTLLIDKFKNFITEDYPFECSDLSNNLCFSSSLEEYTNNLSILIKKLIKN